ncbi:MAG: hypothetical protein JWP35_2219 [Caulobacter sp.]|jgi:hypothetical protein|nr:hypothetical protein [Caulobacter sp.]
MIRRLATLAAAALAALTLMSAAPALAAPAPADRSAACLWNGLPAPIRDSFYADYPAKGGAALTGLSTLTDPQAVAMMSGCGLEKTDPTLVGQLLAAYGLKTGSAALLKSKWNIDAAKVDKAWAALPAAQRQPLLDGAKTFSPLGAPAHAAIDAVCDQLKITDPTTRSQVAIYLMGTAIIVTHPV